MKVKVGGGAASCTRLMMYRVGVVAVVLMGAVSIAHAAVPSSERTVLENLYVSTDGAHWYNNEGWNGPAGSECAWHGITCNSAGTSVLEIDLADNGLDGVLPPLADLTNLESLVLGKTPGDSSGSQTNGGLIPLPGEPNELYGPIPPLNSLEKLKTFVAINASFSGDVPSLAGMNNLEHFQCTGCGLDGRIVSLKGLTHLKVFQVSGNPLYGSLTGSIPSLAGLSQLQFFNVSGEFTGKLPDLSGLKQLQVFEVEGYRFTGGVPDLVDLPNLQSFYVHGLLTGQMGKLENLPALQEVYVADNLLSGNIPSLASVPNLQGFDASDNQLDGSVPDLAGLTQLQYFNVAFNQLSRSLPTPPQSLIDNVDTAYPSTVCPNMLTPSSSPPSATDLAWDTISNSTPWSQACVPDPLWKTAVGVSSSRNPSIAGQPVTLTGVVRGMNPTGTITFTAISDPPGKTPTTLCDSVPLRDGIATCAVASLPPGLFHITASYSGDDNNAAGKNGDGFADTTEFTLSQLVSQHPFTEATTANPAQVGQPVDLTLTYGAGQDGDTANFYDGDKALCTNVAVHTSRAGPFIARCRTQFAAAGVHILTSTLQTSSSHKTIPMIQNVVDAKSFDADQLALTGPWYNPATSGQGLQFSVYPDLQGDGVATLVGGWFTFDDSGQQRWMALQGDLSTSHGGTYDLKIGQNSGGNFNAGPVTTPASVIGSAELSFYDCGHAAMSYQFDDGRSGTIPYVRLDPSTECSSAVPAGPYRSPPMALPEFYADALHGGAWYDPATSGQGLFLDLAPKATTLFGAWFSYLPASDSATGAARQRWFTLQDNDYTPGDLDLHDVKIIRTTGGKFDQPTPVEVEQVGNADINFTSCTRMTLKYRFDKGEFSGLAGTINEQVIGGANPACEQASLANSAASR